MGLKQVRGISTLLHNFVLGYTIRKIQEDQRLEMNGYIVSFYSMLTKLSCWGKITGIIKEKKTSLHNPGISLLVNTQNSLNIIHIPCSCLLPTSVTFIHFTKLVLCCYVCQLPTVAINRELQYYKDTSSISCQ
jgi:hypothetical protein